jgi:hypothetical protein
MQYSIGINILDSWQSGYILHSSSTQSTSKPERTDTMQKLLNTYRKLPSPSNRAKLQAYLNKHMMAVCLASAEDIAFLKAHEFKV